LKTVLSPHNGAPQILVDCKCQLGEGPLWCADSGRLYWADIEGQRLWRWSEAEGAASCALPGPASFLARGPAGTLVTAMARGFGLIEAATGRVLALGSSLRAPSGTRFNDGKTDRQGRVIAGGADLAESEPTAGLFQLSPQGFKPLPGRFTVFNGPAFSPDGRRIYFADSPSKVIRTASYDPDSGMIGRPEPFAILGAESGYPDGMTVDAAGGLWNAEWDGWQITRYHASGEVDFRIALPVPRPTSVTFGGADYDLLFITSARSRLDAAELTAAPLSGNLFALRPGATGLAEAAAVLPRDSQGWDSQGWIRAGG